MAASLAVLISLDWSARSLSAREWWPSSTEPRGMILHATWEKIIRTCRGSCMAVDHLTCSMASSLRASLTLPMLPAPMVLPSIHFPDCVGIVVRGRACLDADADVEGATLPSATPWCAGVGPALCAVEGAISAAGSGGAPWDVWCEERWLLRRWG